MTVTIPDPNTILDFAAVGFVLLMTITLVLSKPTPSRDVARFVVAGMLLGVIVALLSNCALLPTPPPTRTVDTESVDRCQGLIALACTHDERCGGAPALDCMMEQSPPCQGATGLTEAESNACSLSMLETPCGGAYPDACRNIIGPPVPLQSPQPSTRSL